MRKILLTAFIFGSALAASAQQQWMDRFEGDYEFWSFQYNQYDSVSVANALLGSASGDEVEYDFVYHYDNQGRCIREDCYQLGILAESIFAYYTRYEYGEGDRIERRITANWLPFKFDLPVESGYYNYHYDSNGILDYITCDAKQFASSTDTTDYNIIKVDSVKYNYNSADILQSIIGYKYQTIKTTDQTGKDSLYTMLYMSSKETFKYRADGNIEEKNEEQYTIDEQISNGGREVWEYNRDKTIKTFTDYQLNGGQYVPANQLVYHYIDTDTPENYISPKRVPYIYNGMNFLQEKPIDHIEFYIATEDTHELMPFDDFTAYYTDECPRKGVENVSDNASFEIYPTTVEDVLHMSCSEKKATFEIYNINGHLVVKGTNAVGYVNLSTLSKGVYVIKCCGKSAKFVKQ
jgi:hypothetical protein